jgi:hypothetical protein
MAASQIGLPGTRVQSRVVEDLKDEPERAQTQHHNMAARTVPVTNLNLKRVMYITVQVSKTLPTELIIEGMI